MRIAVYAAAALDYVNGRGPQPGGPHYYAQLVFRAAGLPVKVAAVDSSEQCRAVYHHWTSGDTRVSRLYRRPRCGFTLIDAEAALFSPIAGEYGVAELSRVVQSYQLTAVDLQGFVRVWDSSGLLFNRGELASAVLSTVPIAVDRVIVKASLEDLGGYMAASTLLRILDYRVTTAVTMGGLGVAALSDDTVVYAAPRGVASTSVGAGDMFTSMLLYMLLRGEPFPSAVCSAVGAVYCVLNRLGSSGKVEYGDCWRAARGGELCEKVYVASTRSIGLVRHPHQGRGVQV